MSSEELQQLVDETRVNLELARDNVYEFPTGKRLQQEEVSTLWELETAVDAW